jgi:hypothetical protein
MRDRT